MIIGFFERERYKTPGVSPILWLDFIISPKRDARRIGFQARRCIFGGSLRYLTIYEWDFASKEPHLIESVPAYPEDFLKLAGVLTKYAEG